MIDGIRNMANKRRISLNKRGSNLQPNKNFESIIDTPLGSCKGSNHDYTKRKATGEKTPQS